jgi:Flp pilus assembly protein TadG
MSMTLHPRKNRVVRRGSIAVLAAFFLVVVIAFLAFSIDYGYIVVAESDLQNAADAGAMSGARALNDGREAAILAAKNWAGKNVAAGQSVAVADEDVEIGRWDADAATFTAVPTNSSDTPNAVRVTCRRNSGRGNPLHLFFAPIIGTDFADLTLSAIALRPARGVGTRFLIDDEMIDKDVPAIEDVANRLGRDVEKLVTPRGFNEGKKYGDSNWTWTDNFLDLPSGEILSLPTGQGTSYSNNDAGLFDIDHPDFPFQDDVSFLDFLMYSETGGDSSKWGTDKSTIKSKLDPLRGVSPVTDSSRYDSFVYRDFVHVSPITFSDVSTLNMDWGVPQVNAKGLRRGLIAFKIIAVGPDPDGGGSVLPELVIEIVDPATINPNDLKPPGESGGGSGKTKLVQ